MFTAPTGECWPGLSKWPSTMTKRGWHGEKRFTRSPKFSKPQLRRRRPNLSTAESEQLARMIVWAGERFLHQEAGDSPTGTDDVKVWALIEMAWKLMND